MRDDLFIRRRLFRFALHFTLELIVGNKFIHLRRPSATTHFEIAQDNCALTVLLEKNKRVARPEFRRVKHVRVDVARRDDESCSIFSLHFVMR